MAKLNICGPVEQRVRMHFSKKLSKNASKALGHNGFLKHGLELGAKSSPPASSEGHNAVCFLETEGWHEGTHLTPP